MHYDEFGLLHENAAEFGIPFDPERPPAVTRVHTEAPSGHRLSALVWGSEPPEVVLVHGGGQNAHTWDTVALALDLPLVAIDLPGHGHSQWRDSKDYRPHSMAEDLGAVIAELAPAAHSIVGMSLGGLATVATMAANPGLAERVVIVDVTPGVNREKASAITSFIAGPEEFDSFEEILERTVLFNPTRSESSLRRGILHNAAPLGDGRWAWRYDRFTPDREATDANPSEDGLGLGLSRLWDDIAGLDHPMLFCKGAASPVVDDDDLSELRRRKPDVRIEIIEGAGHSIQGDRPVELATLMKRFFASA